MDQTPRSTKRHEVPSAEVSGANAPFHRERHRLDAPGGVFTNLPNRPAAGDRTVILIVNDDIGTAKISRIDTAVPGCLGRRSRSRHDLEAGVIHMRDQREFGRAAAPGDAVAVLVALEVDAGAGQLFAQKPADEALTKRRRRQREKRLKQRKRFCPTHKKRSPAWARASSR